MAFTLGTTLGELLGDAPQVEAVVNERLPGISGNPLVALAEGLSLKTILAMSQAAAWCGCVTGISRPDYDAANPVPSGLKAP